jgi:hypothetical protein
VRLARELVREAEAEVDLRGKGRNERRTWLAEGAVLERTARQMHVSYLRPRLAPSAGTGPPGALQPAPAAAGPPALVASEVEPRPA